MPGAIWRPVVNRSPNMGPVHGMVLHHMVGPEESAYNRFNQPASQASSHFGIKLNGEIEQYVDTADKAWHACNANHTGWIGNENESPGQDDPSTPQNELWDPLSREQVEANGRILKWLHEEHGVPIQVTDDLGIGGVAYHSMNPGPCNAAWGLTGCPGPSIIAQRDAVVAMALGQEPDWAAITAAVQAHYRKRNDDMVVLQTFDGKAQAYALQGNLILQEFTKPGTPATYGIREDAVAFAGNDVKIQVINGLQMAIVEKVSRKLSA